MAATERGDGGNIGRLKQRIGGHFGDDARDALAVRSEDALERFEVENIADVNVVAGTGGKFFENRDRIEVEPTELEPDRAAAGAIVAAWPALSARARWRRISAGASPANMASG